MKNITDNFYILGGNNVQPNVAKELRLDNEFVPKTEKQLRKKGQPVDKRFCQHMRAPVFIQKTKVCIKQQCQQAKWEVSPWSRVSSAHSFFFSATYNGLWDGLLSLFGLYKLISLKF